MGVLAWIIIGGLAGWLARKIAGRNNRIGLIGNIVIGIVGAMLGGFLISLMTGNAITWDFNFQSFLVAIFGSVVLLTIINLLKGK